MSQGGAENSPQGQQDQGLQESRPTLYTYLIEKGGGEVIQVSISIKVDCKTKESNQEKELQELQKAIETIVQALQNSGK